VLPDLWAAITSYVIPYNIAFKWATVLGSVTLPVAAYAGGRLLRLRPPVPAVLAVATLPFLFDYTWTIYGGNLFSTLAGEYAFSLSLSLALVFVGLFGRGIRDGRHRGWAAVVLALCIAAHILPAMFALAAGALLSFGQFRLRQGSRIDWVVAGWVTVGAGLVAVLLQIWELIKLPFYPGSSGYSSCFIAWAVMNISLLLGSVYWIETLLARSIRLHRALVSEAGHTAALPPERMFMANAAGCALFWQFAAVVSAFFWLLFYII